MIRVIYTVIFGIWALNCYAWNAVGHKVIAQIAYDNLSPNAKKMCTKYLRSSNPPEAAFLAASTWMDKVKSKNIHQYDLMHYIDIPFSVDGTIIPPVEDVNAVSAIKDALAMISKSTRKNEKRLALRLLIHIVGDIHQPLHAITRVSSQLPKGDLGGNLFPLGANSVGKNLHQYWDSGAGYFRGHYNTNKIKNKAWQLEQKWPCEQINELISPKKWANDAHKIAIKYGYQLNPNDSPDEKYQAKAQILAQKQVAYAGCRLAMLLNKQSLRVE